MANATRTPNVGPCTVEGCEQPMRKRQWCASHYAQWKRYGEVRPFIYKWADETACLICGAPNGNHRSRKYCSAGCQQAASRAGKDRRPETATCDFCQREFSLRTRTPNGRLQRIDTKWCPDCGRESPDVQRFRRYGITREQYDEAMAAGCSICKATDRKLHVDHDHACCSGKNYCCGKCVRGLICGPCNRGIGLFADDPEALIRAAAYLRHNLSTSP